MAMLSVSQNTVNTHVRKGKPPVLILHGTKDATVPVEQSQRMAEALTQAGVEHELILVEGAPHSFHLEPKEKEETAEESAGLEAVIHRLLVRRKQQEIQQITTQIRLAQNLGNTQEEALLLRKLGELRTEAVHS